MEQLSALSSHDPRCFASKPQPQPQPQPRPETTSQSAARLLFKAHWKLNTESAREEPRLRRLLGHISVYDRTRTFAQAQVQAESQSQTQPSAETRPEEEPNELSVYIRHQVPSFKEFQAALEVQLETIAQIRAAAEAQYKNAEEYNSDEEEEDDSDYDSCDGDWSDDDEDTSAESDDSSCTDYESEGQRSECSSPTFDSAHAKYDQLQEDEDDVWAIRPLIPLVSNRSADSG
ncbi:uncharacterized protein Z520_08865 [Fonsecaea multimorphosa CBS 102226]|uniref:Uncharacterized protein n=1 Tax=Fonsecaea multimorphosa CBS 102226 TaxID=1442371 RepID=A0A0D2KF92_9EURO|nr:uncharacterized protein Z520_08865 [Fonsecaea multimorphosa CBS 102226]KIX95348.1 hypothetical protein Z520_08865 [Fonsecaea multimorphosa CBS 102226]OAL21144.1 hypothetical protein AYO22_08301 [Fonsecaea multimorphosa]